MGVIDSQGRHARTRGERAEVVWVMRLAAGHSGAPLDALYDAYASRIFGLGLEVFRDEGFAEILVEETFLRLWRSADHYDPASSSVPTFVSTLVVQVVTDLARRLPIELAAAFAEPEEAARLFDAAPAVTPPDVLRGRTFLAIEQLADRAADPAPARSRRLVWPLQGLRSGGRTTHRG